MPTCQEVTNLASIVLHVCFQHQNVRCPSMLQFVMITLLGGWTAKEAHWQTRLARHLADTLDLSLLAIDATGRGE